MDRTTGYFDLLEAFPKAGCPLCQLGRAAVHRYIEAINYESAGDPGVREQLRAAFGFCTVHAYQWLHQAHVLGTAAIYTDVLTQTLATLRALSFQPHTLIRSVADRLGVHARQEVDVTSLAAHGQCPACRVLDETDDMLLHTLLAMLPQPAFQEAYASSSGLCLPHLRLALERVEDEEAFATLRDVAITREELLLAQLREIIRRHNYRFMQEPGGAERGAPERAVQHVVGTWSAPVKGNRTGSPSPAHRR